MRYSKKLLFIAVILIIGVLLTIPFVIVKTNIRQNEKQKFSSYKGDFEMVNKYILDICSSNTKTSFNIIYEDKKISSLVMFSEDSSQETKIFLKDDIKEALNNIEENLMTSSFDYIDVTSERISYGGLGNRVYVYSRNGEKPTYYLSPNNDRASYNTYYLNDNWYMLKSISR